MLHNEESNLITTEETGAEEGSNFTYAKVVQAVAGLSAIAGGFVGGLSYVGATISAEAVGKSALMIAGSTAFMCLGGPAGCAAGFVMGEIASPLIATAMYTHANQTLIGYAAASTFGGAGAGAAVSLVGAGALALCGLFSRNRNTNQEDEDQLQPVPTTTMTG